MNALLWLFKTERIKWRRNWFFVLALLVPICQVFFLFEIFWFSDEQIRRIGPGFPAWYFINHAAWNEIFMPVIAAIICALSWEMEEDCQSWKHLLLQPIQRSAHYLSKVISHLSLLFSAQILFGSMLFLGGVLLRVLVPSLEMGPVHPDVLLNLTLASMVGMLPIVCLHTWISTRVPGVMFGLITTLGGTWLTLHLAEKTPWIYVSPWCVATQASGLVQKGGQLPWVQVFVGLACALVLVILGYLDFLPHRDKQN